MNTTLEWEQAAQKVFFNLERPCASSNIVKLPQQKKLELCSTSKSNFNVIFPEYYYRESKTVFSNESHIKENKFADFRRHPKTRSCQKITETAATQK